MGLTGGCWGTTAGWGTATGSRWRGESGSTGRPCTGKLENLEGAPDEAGVGEGLDALLASLLLGTGVGANAGLSGCLVGRTGGVFCTFGATGLAAGNELKAGSTGSVEGLAENDWKAGKFVGTPDLGDSALVGWVGKMALGLSGLDLEV